MIKRYIFMLVALITSFLKFDISYAKCSSYSFNVNDGVENHVLDTRIFSSIPIKNSPSECFWQCSLDCRCLSFNLCGNECQLNADSKDIIPKSLKMKYGCSYYDMSWTQVESFPPCCVLSNPCVNGGSCLSGVPKSVKRFQCTCNTDYYGDVCQIKNPKTCADFLTKETKPLSGMYKILDDNGTAYSVYCDFDSEPGFAWTLSISFIRDNGAHISSRGLLEDLPVNGDTPNWENYRMPLARMNTIRKHSSHWRATCGYNIYSVDYQDYIRVNLSTVDFSSYYFNVHIGPTACQTIEYMHILGSQCNNCNFALYYHERIPYLNLIISTSWSKCSFDLTHKGHTCENTSITTAQLFMIGPCLDPRFRCHREVTSTTQNWFGRSSIDSSG